MAEQNQPAVVRITRQDPGYRSSDAPRVVVLQTLVFENEDLAKDFAKGFGKLVIDDYGDSFYLAEVSPRAVSADETTKYHVLHGVSIDDGRFVSEARLVGPEDIEKNAEFKMAVSTEGRGEAFALAKDGTVRKLEGDNVGVLTYWTTYPYLAELLNKGETR